MQERCKHAFSTREAVFSAWSLQSTYKEQFSREEITSSFETPAYQGMSLGAEESN
jgi:hypothetical protein